MILLLEIVKAFIILGIMGVIFGAGLGFASRFCVIEEDNKLSKIKEALPGANCGACGYKSCYDYASHIASGEATPSACAVGGNKTAREIADILGISFDAQPTLKAVVLCRGNKDNATSKFVYEGLNDCVSASGVGGGFKECRYGCLGYGNCVAACKFGAISIVNGVSSVDAEKCTGCGMCAAACPKGIIEMMDVGVKYYISCCSKDKGANTKKYCSVGCLACGLCVKKCRAGAIYIDKNHARIDARLCTNCGECISVCPMGTILTKQIPGVTTAQAQTESQETVIDL